MRTQLLRRIAFVAGLFAMIASFSGCGAFVLANPDEYRASVRHMREEMAAAAADARAAAQGRDRGAYQRAVGRVLNACGDAERLESYGEQAIRSYYGQQSTRTAMAQIALRAYEQNCRVDGQDRLREERIALDDTARVLREACGCPRTDGYITFGTCSFAEAAWDDYASYDAQLDASILVGGVATLATGGIGAFFMTAGLFHGMAENIKDKHDHCRAVHAHYTREYQAVAALTEQCSRPPSSSVGFGALTPEELAERIDGALAMARNGAGSDVDGSSVYGDAWVALQECNELAAMLDPDAGFILASEIDTRVDQEPGDIGEYEIPEYTPPPETPAPPGGG